MLVTYNKLVSPPLHIVTFPVSSLSTLTRTFCPFKNSRINLLSSSLVQCLSVLLDVSTENIDPSLENWIFWRRPVVEGMNYEYFPFERHWKCKWWDSLWLHQYMFDECLQQPTIWNFCKNSNISNPTLARSMIQNYRYW